MEVGIGWGHGAGADEEFNPREHFICRSKALCDENGLMATAIRKCIDSILKSTYRLIDPIIDMITLKGRSIGHVNVRVKMGRSISHFVVKDSVVGAVGIECGGLLTEPVSLCWSREGIFLGNIYLVAAVAPSAVLWTLRKRCALMVFEASLE